jgi:hypothetical protein
MSSLDTIVTVLTGVAGTGLGAVAHRAWVDFGVYLRGNRTEVERVVDEAVNRGIDVLAQMPPSPRDSTGAVSAPEAESVKTASVPATGEEVSS